VKNTRNQKIRKEIDKLPYDEKMEVYLAENPEVCFLKKRIAEAKKKIRKQYKRFEY